MTGCSTLENQVAVEKVEQDQHLEPLSFLSFSNTIFTSPYSLQSSIDFQKEEFILLGIKDEFHRSSTLIVQQFPNLDCRFMQFPSQFIFTKQSWRWRFFDYFLMSSLNRTFSFTERNDISMRISKDLNFDVFPTCYVTF